MNYFLFPFDSHFKYITQSEQVKFIGLLLYLLTVIEITYSISF